MERGLDFVFNTSQSRWWSISSNSTMPWKTLAPLMLLRRSLFFSFLDFGFWVLFLRESASQGRRVLRGREDWDSGSKDSLSRVWKLVACFSEERLSGFDLEKPFPSCVLAWQGEFILLIFARLDFSQENKKLSLVSNLIKRGWYRD